VKSILIVVLSSALALAGQFAIYPGAKLMPPLGDKTADIYVTPDPYNKVVAFYTKTGKVVRTIDNGGRRTGFSLDQGVEVVVWEVKDHVVSISVKKGK